MKIKNTIITGLLALMFTMMFAQNTIKVRKSVGGEQGVSSTYIYCYFKGKKEYQIIYTNVNHCKGKMFPDFSKAIKTEGGYYKEEEGKVKLYDPRGKTLKHQGWFREKTLVLESIKTKTEKDYQKCWKQVIMGKVERLYEFKYIIRKDTQERV